MKTNCENRKKKVQVLSRQRWLTDNAFEIFVCAAGLAFSRSFSWTRSTASVTRCSSRSLNSCCLTKKASNCSIIILSCLCWLIKEPRFKGVRHRDLLAPPSECCNDGLGIRTCDLAVATGVESCAGSVTLVFGVHVYLKTNVDCRFVAANRHTAPESESYP